MARGKWTAWLAVCTLQVIALVASPAAAEAQTTFAPASHDWDGYADFMELLRAQAGSAIAVADRLDYGALRRADVLLIVHPETRLDVDSITAFLEAGGHVVLLDDFGTGDRLLRHFAVERVPLPATPAASLRHNPELAMAEPASEHELVRGVAHVVTNHATGLVPRDLTTLLQVRSTDGSAVILGLIGHAARGKLVAIGDPSALMNSMLRYPGNAQLAKNLAAFMAGAGGTIYVAVGSFQQQGTFVGSPLLDAVHVAGTALSTSGSRALAGLGPRAAQLVAALVGLSVIVWIGAAAGRTYRPGQPRLTRVIPLTVQGGVAGHAALVGARGSPRSSALLEIGKSLEEELTLALGLDRVPTHDALVGRLLHARRVEPAMAVSLRKLLLKVARIDTLMSAGRTAALPRITDHEVLEAAEVASAVRAQVRAPGGSTRVHDVASEDGTAA